MCRDTLAVRDVCDVVIAGPYAYRYRITGLYL